MFIHVDVILTTRIVGCDADLDVNVMQCLLFTPAHWLALLSIRGVIFNDSGSSNKYKVHGIDNSL